MRIHYKIFILFVISLSLFTNTTISAQDTVKVVKKPPRNSDIMSRISFGGYLGLQFGSVTVVDIAPLATYNFTEKIYGGLGLTYMYYKDNRYQPAFSLSSYGGSVFGGYYIWRDLFAHIEYAPLYIPDYYDYYQSFTQPPKSPWAHDLYLGGGYRQWVGERASVNLMILFNVNETEFSPYSNPIIRIGFGVGL
jgi:hypothetical protein